jgi:hypothetical protein
MIVSKLRSLFNKTTGAVPNNPNNSDLFIVEFPKGGITWFSTIIANSCFLEEGINKKATHFNLEQFIGDVHQNKVIGENKIFPYHRIIKSHDVFNKEYRHVIYLMRNPFSVMVSYYHFAINNKFFKGSFESFVKDESLGIKTWVKHVSSWTKPEKMMKFHYLRYEDLMEKPNQTIKNLYTNLGWDLSNEIIEESINLSNFKSMKVLNNHYRDFCPFRKYDFVREGKKKAELNSETENYIYEHSLGLLKEFYPEFLKK